MATSTLKKDYGIANQANIACYGVVCKPYYGYLSAIFPCHAADKYTNVAGSNFNIENGNSDVSVTVRSIAKKGNSLRVVLDSSDTNYIGCAISGVLTFS